MRLSRRSLAAAFVTAVLTVGVAGCQDKPAAAKLSQLETRVQQLEKQVDDLRPPLGGIMLELQQHHAKLWFAGRSRHWELARYELAEIREGLDDAVKFHADFNGVQVATLAPANTQGPLRDLDAALEQRSPEKFSAAYDALSAACSNCHRQAKHPFIRLQRPGPGPFGDQDFRP